MTDVELISSRLQKLERQCRRTRLIAVAICGLMGAGAIMAQQPPGIQLNPPRSRQELGTPVSGQVEEQVRARQFILMDENGKERASLVADRAGSVFLVLFDQNEKSRANLSVSPDGPSLVFYDPDGKARTILGSTTLVASHVNEKGVMERAPASSIVLFDRAGKLLFRTP
jgi:hypothetical protein